jgi:hypothetical protein
MLSRHDTVDGILLLINNIEPVGWRIWKHFLFLSSDC